MSTQAPSSLSLSRSLVLALLIFMPAIAVAQDHSQHQPRPTKERPTQATPEREPSAEKEISAEDHAATGHEVPPEKDAADHSDHADMQHGAGQHAEHDQEPSPSDLPREPIPRLTDADRAAAFPPLANGHAAHDLATHTFFQIDQLEAWDADDGTGLSWEALGWAGGDVHRVWLRSEGERVGGHTESSDLELLYGRAVSRWWDLVIGVQHDFSPGSSQTFAGIGVIGLSPYKFEIEATAYVGESGQLRADLEAEYELLLTNRLILQPLVELGLHGKDDPRRGIAAGPSSIEAGVRLRYEFTRRLAPYVGFVYERALADTADLRRAEGADTSDTLIVAGVRTWF